MAPIADGRVHHAPALLTLLAGLALLVPSAVAEQPLYLQGELGIGTVPPTSDFETQVGYMTPGNVVAAGPVTNSAGIFRYLVQAGGDLKPTTTSVWFALKSATVLPPAGQSTAFDCPIYVEIGVNNGGQWYYCAAGDPSWVGKDTFQLKLTWTDKLVPTTVKPGDEVYVAFWNMGSSTAANPSLYVVNGPAADSSFQAFEGIHEPLPLAEATGATPSPSPTASPDATASAAPSPTSSAPATTSPPPSSSAAAASSGGQGAPAPKGSEVPAATPSSTTKPSPGASPVAVVAALAALVAILAARRQRCP